MSLLISSTKKYLACDRLPACTLDKATIGETKDGKLSFYSKLEGTVEKTMDEWLSNKEIVDIWQIEDRRAKRSSDKPSRPSQRPSWGKIITGLALGGLLISACKQWNPTFNQTPISDLAAMMKGTLGSVALKTVFVFQTTIPIVGIIAALGTMRREQSVAISGALLAGLMLLPKQAKAEPLCPQLVGSYDTPGTAWGIAVSGNYAYVADRLAGLQIINVSDVTNPTLAGSYNTSGSAQDVVISGKHAYVTGYDVGGLQILDVSDVTNPTLAGSYNTPGYAEGVAVSDKYAYVADYNSGLLIFDVSNVTNPILVGSYDTPGNAYGVVVSGSYAYVADETSGLLIFDVSNVTNPILVGSYDTPGRALSVTVFGNHAYVADHDAGGLQILDVSNVTNPSLVGSYDTPGYACDIALSGNYAYVADYGFGLQILDVSNVTSPTLVGSCNTPGVAHGIAVLGNYAYVADSSSGLQIISRLPCPTSTSPPSTLRSVTNSQTERSVAINSIATNIFSNPSSTNALSTSASIATNIFSNPSSTNALSTSAQSNFLSSIAMTSSRPIVISHTNSFSNPFSNSRPASSISNSDRSITPTRVDTEINRITTSQNNKTKLFLIIGIPSGIVIGSCLVSLLMYLYWQRRQKEKLKETKTDNPDNIELGPRVDTFISTGLEYANFPTRSAGDTPELAYDHLSSRSSPISTGLEYSNYPPRTRL